MKGQYVINNLKYRWKKFFFVRLFLYGLTCCLFLFPNDGYAQLDSTYDETIVTVSEPNIGRTDMSAIIHYQHVYLPVKELFDFLSIYNAASASDNISGFYIYPGNLYLFDTKKNEIVFKDTTINLNENDMLVSYNRLFLRSDYFEKVFGLKCTFNFRSLSVGISTKAELPAVREKRQELMRQNIASLNSGRKADTVFKNRFSMFRFGAADWQLTTVNETNGQNNVRANLDLGGIIAGGEASVFLNYNSGIPFNSKSQFYKWRFINNDHKIIRQINIGRVFTNSTSSLIAPLNGFKISNTPTTYKRSFGTITVSNATEPNWIVELYVNDIMVNYTKADAAGFFTFEVPMVYGSSRIKYKFYGPYGEERSSEQNISIPFTFLPANQLEYSITGGIISDEEKSKFSRANLNYGLNNRFTIGAGVEYLSTVNSGQGMPFINASLRLGSSVILSGEHTYGVVTQANVNYRLANSIQLDFTYAKYVPGQTAVRLSYLEEKKVMVSMPVRTKFFNGFSRLTIDKVTLPENKMTFVKTKYTNAEFMVGGVIAGISSNLTTNARFTDITPKIYSKISVTFQLHKGIRITPQAQYEYLEKKFSILRSEFEKRVFKTGFLNFSYERNVFKKTNIFMAGIRLNLSFAQAAFTIRKYDHSTQFIQTSSGGLMFDSHTGYLMASNQSNVGRGGLLISPFLDYNCNGIRDEGEPGVHGLIVRIPLGQIQQSKNDTLIKITGLEAYNKYYIDLDKNSFDNPSWKIRNKVIEVIADPNNFKLIEVPVAVLGEVSGMIYKNDSKEGMGGVIINIYDLKNNLVAKTLSEPDGYFSYLGLASGSYIVRSDEAQLLKINMTNMTGPLPFRITAKKEGDIVDGLELNISENDKNAIKN